MDRALKQVLRRFEQSRNRVEQRMSSLPMPEYDRELPITAHRQELINAIRKHQVVIVAGETGSGKTTQLPKLCLDAGRGSRGLIACTQPRRIAARAMAERVSEELGSELGKVVGYQVRFRERSSPDGYIKFMTDGILLADSMNDRYLDQYDTIIIDEAHERSLNIDFLLGYMNQLLPRRPDLKLLITSATIDTEKFSTHFNHAPVIEVSGRSHPVEMLYQALSHDGSKGEPGDRDLYQGIAEAVRRLGKIDPSGDILVFLSGEREIREAGDFLRRQISGRQGMNTEILPLYARLSSAEQRRVFHPGPKRQDHYGHQRGRDFAHSSQDPVCDRLRDGQDQPLRTPQPDSALADRACFPGKRQPASWTLWPSRARNLRSPVQRSRFRIPA